MINTFALTGSVTLINNGTWYFNSNSDLYFETTAYWINLGLLEVINYYNDFIQASTFPGAGTGVGTVVNMGTIEFSNTGGLNFYDGTGTFRQCSDGILKFNFNGTSIPGTQNYPPQIYLAGYIGVAISSDFLISSGGDIVFNWKPADNTAIPQADVSFLSKGIDPLLLNLCFAKTGEVTLYKRVDEPICPTDTYSPFTILPLAADACASLPDSIKNLQASCPATVVCGVDTGTASGPAGSPSSANVNAASLAFFVSLICLLFKF